MKLILGVDPGASGALAILDENRQIRAITDMPSHDGVVSGVGVAKFLSILKPNEAWVEAVHSMPGQGVASSFKFGRALGAIDGVLGALRIPVHYVTPAKWKAAAGLSRDKSASRRRATELWPMAATQFSRVKDDGRAEAALIALYGLAQHP